MRSMAETSSPVPKVSVVVPVFNDAELLPGTLEALLAQTLQPIEIVLSDDGSTDGSADLCRRFAAEHPDVARFVSGPNRGVSVARNRGLDAARGEWVAFCDADDIPHPDLYEGLLSDAVRTGADFATCAFRTVSPSGVNGPLSIFPHAGNFLLDGRREIDDRLLLPLLEDRDGWSGCPWVELFRRDIVEEHRVRFVPRVQMAEDRLFLVEYLLHANRVCSTDRVGYDYMQYRASSSFAFTRGSEQWRYFKNWYRHARERARLFRTWDRRFHHPFGRLKHRARVFVRLVRYLSSSPFPAVRKSVCRPLRRLVAVVFPPPKQWFGSRPRKRGRAVRR